MSKSKIYRIDSCQLTLIEQHPPKIKVTAWGKTSTSNCKDFELVQTEVVDGVIHFDFVAEMAKSPYLPIMTAIDATTFIHPIPDNFKKVVIHSELNSCEASELHPATKDPYAKDPHHKYPKDPHGHDKDPYTKDPHHKDSKDPHGHDKDPYAKDPHHKDPKDPHGHDKDPYAKDPHHKDPKDPHGHDKDPYAKDPHHKDTYEPFPVMPWCPQCEPIYSIEIKEGKLKICVASNGHTTKKDFTIQIDRNECGPPHRIYVYRMNPDKGKYPHPEGIELVYSLEEFNIHPWDTFEVKNLIGPVRHLH